MSFPPTKRWLRFVLRTMLIVAGALLLPVTSIVQAVESERPTGDKVSGLVQQLRDKNKKVRTNAALALKELGSAATIAGPALLNCAVRDCDETVRLSAVEALVRIDMPIIPAVTKVLGGDSVSTTRANAAIVLGHIGNKDVVVALVQAFGDDDLNVRANAARALGLIGPSAKSAVRPLCELLNDEEKLVCQTALSALGAIQLKRVPGVPQRYWFLYEPNVPFSELAEASARRHLPFDKISLERICGMSLQPEKNNYIVTLHRDGTATHVVTRHMNDSSRSGGLTGDVHLMDFGRLCFLLDRLKFVTLPADIRQEKGHGSAGWATIVRAYRQGREEPIVVWEINNSGPIEFWAIQKSIDGIAARIDWKERPNGMEESD